MIIILTIFLFSVILNSFLYIPYIHVLYRLKFQRQKQTTKDAFEKPTPIFDRFHREKAGTPIGGGLLVLLSTAFLFPIMLLLMRYFFVPITEVYNLAHEIKIIIFTFLGFGLLGLYDDLKKTFTWAKDSFFGLRLRHKLFIEIILATIVAYWLYADLRIQILNIPFLGVFHLGLWFIPFAVLVIVAFSNAFNITDGLDGLAGGVLVISLTAFLIISASILDTPLSIFLALWLGGLVGFLYFNVFPARIFLGDVGSLSFGATFAVVGLILGKTVVLMVIGGVFVVEVGSSLIQLLSKKFLGRKVMAAAPLHLWLQYKGWPEPKIVLRAWIVSFILSMLGLWFALISPS